MTFLLHLILFFLPSPGLLSLESTLLSESHQSSRDAKHEPIKVVISEPCLQKEHSDPSKVNGQELELDPSSPLVLTHRIRVVPATSPGSCCQTELATLSERIERLEREVSTLREKCEGPEGGCCTHQQSKGAGCTTVRPSTNECANNCNEKGLCVNGICVCFLGFTGPDCSGIECPRNCSDKGKCVNGKCVCNPGFSGPDCSTAQCPGNCKNKGKCVNNQCVCNPGFTGPDCSERSCPGNCNNQGRCVKGKCVCDAGFTGLDCSERSCPGNCKNKGRCVNGECVCDVGFTGPDCSERSCPGNCNNQGRCVKGKCVCDAGFTGLDCSERSCPGNCKNKGRCVNGECVCDVGFTGPDCSERSCPGNCNNQGRCVKGKCVCDVGFTGPDCSKRSCPGNCNNKGKCVNGQCVCDSGFTGPDCSERSCPENCNNKGRCVNGQCVCEAGFSGLSCSIKACPNNCKNQGRCVNGNCVCDVGFTGPDCSIAQCPGNCNNRGRCVKGQCVCDVGFTGEDCSSESCPGNCNNRGRCVSGQCVCDVGFTGKDCSTKSCPGNCNNRGRCLNGLCVCDVGFIGEDCSTKSCPGNCNNRGRCLNGLCVCDVGFIGEDCSTKSCPGNCNNRGKCINGRCVCNNNFAEPDCSECQDRFTGPDCTTPLTGVSQLNTRNITDSSVTLFWTPPAVQYTTYYITFTSEKDSEQQITSQISGRLNTYTQIGLAAGQKYTVTIVGEKDGKKGTESMIRFQTLISGPENLQVVKTSTTSVIVQWEEAQGEIDRYILSVSPNDTGKPSKGSQEVRLPPERDSAQIDGLEPGRLYDISLVAEQGGTRSQPAIVQATPGTTITASTMTIDTVAMQMPMGTSGINNEMDETKSNSTTAFVRNHQTKPLRTSEGIRKTNMPPRPVQSRPMLKKKDNVLVTPVRPNVMIRPNGIRVLTGERHLSQPSLKRPIGSYRRPNVSSVDSEWPYPSMRTDTMSLTKKTITGSKKSMDGQITNLGPTGQIPKKTTEDSSSHFWTIISGSEGHADLDRTLGPESEDPLEPTVTTERNLTAYINGTKCVRKVLVGHRKINGRLSKNMTIIVGYVNLLEKVVPGRFDDPSDDIKTLNKEEAKIKDENNEPTPNADETQENTKVERHTTFSNIFRHPQDQETVMSTQRSVYSTPPSPLLLTTIHSPLSPVPSEIRAENTNREDLPSRDGRPDRISLHIPPSSRFTTSLKPSDSSTVLIKGLQVEPISSAPSHIDRDKNLLINVSAGQKTLEREVTASSIPGGQSILTKSVTRFNIAPSETKFSVEEGSPNTEKIIGEHEGTIHKSGRKETTQKTVPPSKRMPPRGTLFHRPNNAGPLTNRTRPGLKYPYRNPLVRSKLPNTINNTSKQAISYDHVKPGTTPNHARVLIQPKLNTTTHKHSLKHYDQISPTYPTIQDFQAGKPVEKGPSKDNNASIDPKVPISSDMAPAKPTDASPAATAVSEDTVNQVPPRDNFPAQQPISSYHVEPEVTSNVKNGFSPNIRQLVLKYKNGTIVRAPSQHTQIKPNPITTHTEDRRDSRVGIPSNKDANREYKTSFPENINANLWPKVTPSTDKSTVTDKRIAGQSVPQVEPEISDQNGFNPKLRPLFILRKKNGTVIRPPSKFHTQIKRNTTAIHGHAKQSNASKHGFTKSKSTTKDHEINFPLDTNVTQEPTINTFSKNYTTYHRLPTNRRGSTAEQIVSHPKRVQEISTSNQTGLNSRRKPQFFLRKKNSTDVKPPPKVPTKIKPKPTTYIWTKTSEAGAKNASSEFKMTIQEEPVESNGTITRPPKLHTQNNPNIQSGLSGSNDFINDTEHGKSMESKDVLLTDKATGKTNRSFTEDSKDDISHVGVNSITSNGFVVIWAAPKDVFKNFVIRVTEKTGEIEKKDDARSQDNGNTDKKEESPKSSEDGIRVVISRLLPGTTRSYPVTNLRPQTSYHVSLFGKGPGLDSNIHTFIINTGPEPPSGLTFTNITDSSFTISWKKTKSPVSGFKVTYTHAHEGEPISETVDSSASSLSLTKLTPGSSYEVSVISVLGLDESDSIKDFVVTLPDSPTDLRAINVTESKALLIWRPALATIDQYVITYGSEEALDPELTIQVSGNAVEEQLQSLKASTKYTVTIFSQLGDQKSLGTRTTFTTTDGSEGKGEGPRDLKANQVMPRTALLSWKPPSSPVTSYKLTYVTEGGVRKEVILDPSVTEHQLKNLRSSSTYTVRLQSERGGIYTAAITTDFTTGSLRYPFPTDCSQELLNGATSSSIVEIFPRGKDGESVLVYCDMESDGGGWTVFQRRKDGKTNFFRGWQDYRKGFGEVDDEFWLGNDLLHNITTMSPMSMRVDLRSGQESVFALYNTFSIDTMRKHYTLHLSGYSGTAGDSMEYHSGRPFSTYDRDPQPFITRCAMSYRGGWWYKNCHQANLNGLYNTNVNHQGIIWTTWKGKDFSIPFTEMKLRPASFRPRSRG